MQDDREDDNAAAPPAVADAMEDDWGDEPYNPAVCWALKADGTRCCNVALTNADGAPNRFTNGYFCCRHKKANNKSVAAKRDAAIAEAKAAGNDIGF